MVMTRSTTARDRDAKKEQRLEEKHMAKSASLQGGASVTEVDSNISIIKIASNIGNMNNNRNKHDGFVLSMPTPPPAGGRASMGPIPQERLSIGSGLVVFSPEAPSPCGPSRNMESPVPSRGYGQEDLDMSTPIILDCEGPDGVHRAIDYRGEVSAAKFRGRLDGASHATSSSERAAYSPFHRGDACGAGKIGEQTTVPLAPLAPTPQPHQKETQQHHQQQQQVPLDLSPFPLTFEEPQPPQGGEEEGSRPGWDEIDLMIGEICDDDEEGGVREAIQRALDITKEKKEATSAAFESARAAAIRNQDDVEAAWSHAVSRLETENGRLRRELTEASLQMSTVVAERDRLNDELKAAKKAETPGKTTDDLLGSSGATGERDRLNDEIKTAKKTETPGKTTGDLLGSSGAAGAAASLAPMDSAGTAASLAPMSSAGAAVSPAPMSSAEAAASLAPMSSAGAAASLAPMSSAGAAAPLAPMSSAADTAVAITTATVAVPTTSDHAVAARPSAPPPVTKQTIAPARSAAGNGSTPGAVRTTPCTPSVAERAGAPHTGTAKARRPLSVVNGNPSNTPLQRYPLRTTPASRKSAQNKQPTCGAKVAIKRIVTEEEAKKLAVDKAKKDRMSGRLRSTTRPKAGQDKVVAGSGGRRLVSGVGVASTGRVEAMSKRETGARRGRGVAKKAWV